MAQSTIYDVQVNYSMGGNARQGIKDVGASAQQAEVSIGSLKGAILGIGAALGVGKALSFGKEAFIGFNSMVEQSTISLAAQEKMLKGGKWSTAMENATGLFKHYQDVAKASVGETKDFLDMHKAIAAQVYRSGLSTKDLKEITKGAVITSQVLGERADMVALDIKQMLQGTINAKDRTAQILIASQGKTQEWFNKQSQKQRAAFVLKALQDPAIQAAAKQMEGSWAGVTSTLKDTLNIAFGKVGMPLFKALTAEVKGWNVWIENNGQKLEQYGRAFGAGLISALGTVKEIVAAIAPIAQLGSGLLKEAAALYKEHSWLKNVTGLGMLQRGGKAASELSKGATGALYGSEDFRKLKGLTDDWYGSRRAEQKAVGKQAFVEEVSPAPLDATKSPSWQAAKQAGDAARQAQVETQKRMLEAFPNLVTKTEKEGLTTYTPVTTKEEATRQLVTDQIGKVANDEIEARRLFIKTLYDDIFGMQRALTYGERDKKEDERTKKLQPEKAKVNVNIHKIEVASPDPDRFVFGMVRSFRQVAENPVTASTTLRGGF